MKEADRGEKEGGEKEGDPESRSARGCWRWKGLPRAKSGKVFPGLKARLGRPQVGDLKGWMKKWFSDASISLGPQKEDLSVRHPCSTQAAEPTLEPAEGCP